MNSSLNNQNNFYHRWKVFYSSERFSVLRHAIAGFLLFLGLLILLQNPSDRSSDFLFFALGCIGFAFLIAFHLALLVVAICTLISIFITLTTSIPTSSAILIGSILIGGAVLIAGLKGKD